MSRLVRVRGSDILALAMRSLDGEEDKRQKAKDKRQKVGRGFLPFGFCLLSFVFSGGPWPALGDINAGMVR